MEWTLPSADEQALFVIPFYAVYKCNLVQMKSKRKDIIEVTNQMIGA